MDECRKTESEKGLA